MLHSIDACDNCANQRQLFRRQKRINSICFLLRTFQTVQPTTAVCTVTCRAWHFTTSLHANHTHTGTGYNVVWYVQTHSTCNRAQLRMPHYLIIAHQTSATSVECEQVLCGAAFAIASPVRAAGSRHSQYYDDHRVLSSIIVPHRTQRRCHVSV